MAGTKSVSSEPAQPGMRQALPTPRSEAAGPDTRRTVRRGMAGRRIYPYGRWLKLERAKDSKPSTPTLQGKAYRPPQDHRRPLISVKCLIIIEFYSPIFRVIPHSSGAAVVHPVVTKHVSSATSQKLNQPHIDALVKHSERYVVWIPTSKDSDAELSRVAQRPSWSRYRRPGGGRNAPKAVFSLLGAMRSFQPIPRAKGPKVLGAVALCARL